MVEVPALDEELVTFARQFAGDVSRVYRMSTTRPGRVTTPRTGNPHRNDAGPIRGPGVISVTADVAAR